MPIRRLNPAARLYVQQPARSPMETPRSSYHTSNISELSTLPPPSYATDERSQALNQTDILFPPHPSGHLFDPLQWYRRLGGHALFARPGQSVPRRPSGDRPLAVIRAARGADECPVVLSGPLRSSAGACHGGGGLRLGSAAV
ncbi:hypothetical protein C8Q80DRAFT_305667 [Daedaleopsis nitida]|nr:hypothetical protein C8Q80DRAFT_305667 [Daedaleopsis nitida]